VTLRKSTNRSRQRDWRGFEARRHFSHRGIDWSRIKWSNLDRALTRFEPDSLVSLISAAADSPACGHRLPSLTLIWSRAVAQPPCGALRAGPSHLIELLVAARKAAPQLKYLEDSWNPDPRLVVRHPIGHDRLRFHPGNFSDPSQFLRAVQSTADAIDPFVLDCHGFSLSDLLEVALRYSDWRVGKLFPTWPSGEILRNAHEPERETVVERAQRIAATPVELHEKEINALGATFMSHELWISHCDRPERAAMAWDWATKDSGVFGITLGLNTPFLGTALSIRSGSQLRHVPASLVLSSLAASTALLAAEATSDKASAIALEFLSVKRALEVLNSTERVADRQELETDVNDATAISAVGLVVTMAPAARHAYSIAVVSNLDPVALVAAIDEADDILTSVTAEDLRRSGVPIEPSASIHRLVLYGGPFHLPLSDHAGIVHLHVDDLAAMKFDSYQSELGQDLIFQFIDELTTMPGVDQLLCLEVADVWRHWKTQGVLSQRGDGGLALVIAFPPDDGAWLTSARWEPIEAVLTAANLPTVWDWDAAHLNERGHATLRSEQHDVYLVLADPPLIVNIAMTHGLVDLNLDPFLGVGLIQGILLTCANFPDVAAGFLRPDREPLMISMEITNERSPDSHDGQLVFGLRTASAPHAEIAIQLGPDWIEFLAQDPEDAHEALGAMLAQGLNELDNFRPGIVRNGFRANFLAHWSAAPPIVMARLQETSLSIRPKGQTTLPRNRSTRARAVRALATTILEDKISPCELFGAEAQELCRSTIIPAMNRTLQRAVSEWSEDAVLAVAEHLNDAHGERARAATELEMSLSAPWAENWQAFAQNSPDPSDETRPLEFFLEFLLAEQPAGNVVPDRFDLAETTDLANLAIYAGTALSGADHGLNTLTVIVDDGGITRVMAGPNFGIDHKESPIVGDRHTVRFDAEAYKDAVRMHQLRRRDPLDEMDAVAVRIGEPRSDLTNPFVSITSIDIPGSLRKADQLMLQECGTGLDGIRAVLGVAETYVTQGDQVVLAVSSDLRNEAITWSSLNAEPIEAAINLLTLDPIDLRSDRIPYWELERRHFRLMTRPLIKFDDRFLLMPWQIHASLGVYFRYLLEGRLPWHVGDVPDSVQTAFNDYRRKPNLALEREAHRIAEGLRLPHKRNIQVNLAATFGLQIPGEIDLLVADPRQSRLWVCEVKDVSAAFSPRTVRTRIDKFLNGEDYVEKLLARASAVRNNLSAAAKLIGAPITVGPWRVIPLMITRDIEPAAFLTDTPVSFTVIDDLAITLQSETDPPSGHTAVGPL